MELSFGGAPLTLQLGENTNLAQLAAATATTKAAEAAASAAAVAVSANTQALRAAIRNFGFYPRPSSALAANDRPTVTFHGLTSFELGSASFPTNPNVPANSAKLKWLSGAMVASGRGYGGAFPYPRGTLGIQGNSIIEFWHNEISLEGALGNNGPTGASNFRIYIGNCLVHESEQPGTDGQINRFKLVFGAVTNRLIRIETELLLIGVNASNPAMVTSTARNNPIVSIIGDSFLLYHSQATVMARALGMSLNNAAAGGTGLIATNAGQSYPNYQDAGRKVDWALNGVTDGLTGAAAVPSLGVIFGTLNDDRDSSFWGGAATLEAAAYNGTSNLLDHWLTYNSGKPVVAFGPWGNTGTPGINSYKIRDGMRNACWRAGQPAWFIDKYGPKPILRDGVRTNAADQASLYTSADDTHPTAPAGHALDGLWEAQQVRELALTQFN